VPADFLVKNGSKSSGYPRQVCRTGIGYRDEGAGAVDEVVTDIIPRLKPPQGRCEQVEQELSHLSRRTGTGEPLQ